MRALPTVRASAPPRPLDVALPPALHPTLRALPTARASAPPRPLEVELPPVLHPTLRALPTVRASAPPRPLEGDPRCSLHGGGRSPEGAGERTDRAKHPRPTPAFSSPRHSCAA